MKIEPAKMITRTGRYISLREAHETDAAGLTTCIQSYLQDGCIPLRNEEFDSDLERRQAWIRSYGDSQNSLLLVAEHQGRITGNIDLTMHERQMLQHTGIVGMGVHQDWQNQGIGTLLMQRLLHYCDTNPAIEILWLQVIGSNVRAQRLYRRMGFQEIGRQNNFVKLGPGSYTDNVWMTKQVG